MFRATCAYISVLFLFEAFFTTMEVRLRCSEKSYSLRRRLWPTQISNGGSPKNEATEMFNRETDCGGDDEEEMSPRKSKRLKYIADHEKEKERREEQEESPPSASPQNSAQGTPIKKRHTNPESCGNKEDVLDTDTDMLARVSGSDDESEEEKNSDDREEEDDKDEEYSPSPDLSDVETEDKEEEKEEEGEEAEGEVSDGDEERVDPSVPYPSDQRLSWFIGPGCEEMAGRIGVKKRSGLEILLKPVSEEAVDREEESDADVGPTTSRARRKRSVMVVEEEADEEEEEKEEEEAEEKKEEERVEEEKEAAEEEEKEEEEEDVAIVEVLSPQTSPQTSPSKGVGRQTSPPGLDPVATDEEEGSGQQATVGNADGTPPALHHHHHHQEQPSPIASAAPHSTLPRQREADHLKPKKKTTRPGLSVYLGRQRRAQAGEKSRERREALVVRTLRRISSDQAKILGLLQRMVDRNEQP